MKKRVLFLWFLVGLLTTIVLSPVGAQEEDTDVQCFFDFDNPTREVGVGITSVGFFIVEEKDLEVISDIDVAELESLSLSQGENLLVLGEVELGGFPASLVFAKNEYGLVVGGSRLAESYYPVADECAEAQWQQEVLAIPDYTYILIDAALGQDHIWQFGDNEEEVVALTGGYLVTNSPNCRSYDLHNTAIDDQPIAGMVTHVVCGDISELQPLDVIYMISAAQNRARYYNGRHLFYFGLPAEAEATLEPEPAPTPTDAAGVELGN